MSGWLNRKSVLITGGAGAFGQKFLREARDKGPARVTIFSRDEMKHSALRREWGAKTGEWLRPVIGDILHPAGLRQAMIGADLVIHAAAMKHLPECEFNVAASTRINVLGTEHVVEAFLESGASTLVFLSTDKAPYASSVYGAQKYIGEKLVTEANRLTSEKRAFCLRYSNVMDSTGSVFHLFKQLLGSDKTATVNGSRTSRGFVSQANVLSCIDRALETARGGEVFVLVPQVVRIAELAETMREIIGRGKVELVEAAGFLGEKESATLVMGEEVAAAREFPEYTDGNVVLLDLLGRHGDRPRAPGLSAHGLTLEDCPRLAGAELKKFVSQLM
jgi:UDP-glucose 4-epimerase